VVDGKDLVSSQCIKGRVEVPSQAPLRSLLKNKVTTGYESETRALQLYLLRHFVRKTQEARAVLYFSNQSRQTILFGKRKKKERREGGAKKKKNLDLSPQPQPHLLLPWPLLLLLLRLPHVGR
jgi:hypothetical protein